LDIIRSSAFSGSAQRQSEENKSEDQMIEEEDSSMSDLDLNASYSDSDYEQIPVNEKLFWEYLQKLEENNLFEMNLLQENQ